MEHSKRNRQNLHRPQYRYMNYAFLSNMIINGSVLMSFIGIFPNRIKRDYIITSLEL